MNGTQRFDYLVPTSIFLRNKEYERHQKKLEEIKGHAKNKCLYYNKQHIEGIRVHNNIKVNNNKFKDKIKNDELQESNNKILKKIIEISKVENGLSKSNNVQLSPRRVNYEEVDKIIRENQILSSKINNVDSQWNNKKIATQYQVLYECKKRIQRFEVIDYEKNQVKLKAFDSANSTYNTGINSLHSRLSHRKGKSNATDDVLENGEYGSQHDENVSSAETDTQNYYQNMHSTNSKLATNQNTPRGQTFDSGRAKSCERERTSLYRKQQYFQGVRQESKTREGSIDQSYQNRGHRQIGTSEETRQRSISRGHVQNSTRNQQEQFKNTSDSKLPQNRYFRNYKKATPGRQSLNISLNSSNQGRVTMSDDQSLNQTGESQYQHARKGGYTQQKQDGQFYNEEEQGYGDNVEDDTQGYNPQGIQHQQIVRYNQNFIQANRESLQDERKSTQGGQNKDPQEKPNSSQIKNQPRIQSAKGNQKDFISHNIRQSTPNRTNLTSAKNTPRNNEKQQQLKKLEQVTNSQTSCKQEGDKIQQHDVNQQKDVSNNNNNQNHSNIRQNQSHHFNNQDKQEQNQHNKNDRQSMKESQIKEDNNKIGSKNETLDDEIKEDTENQYDQEDEDFVQQESIQIDEETKKKFSNNSKDFFKDKNKEKFQIAEQDEYEEDFESQLMQSSNVQTKSQINNNSSQYNQYNVSSKQNKKGENNSKIVSNKSGGLAISNQFQISSSGNNFEAKENKLNTDHVKNKRKEQQIEHSQLKESFEDKNSNIRTSNNFHHKDKDIDESIQDYEDNFEPDQEKY